MSTIHQLYVWMKKRREIHVLPEFPEVAFELGYRRTVDKDTQMQIIEEVGKICPNQKVYPGIKIVFYEKRSFNKIRLKIR